MTTTMQTGALTPHPLAETVFGRASKAIYAEVRESIRQRGILDPLDVTAPDATDNPGCVVDGHMRLEIAVELGLAEVPVRVRPELRTTADQVVFAVAKAKRKRYSQSQRAAQEEAARAIIRAAPESWRRANGYAGRRESEIVSSLTGEAEHSVRRRKKVFQSASSTEALRRAVDDGVISLHAADDLLAAVEKRYPPGSAVAHRAVDEAVRRARSEARGRRKRGAQLPVAGQKTEQDRAREFWRVVHAQIHKWVVAEIAPDLAEKAAAPAAVQRLMSDLAADIRCVTKDFRRRLRRELDREPAPVLSDDEAAMLGEVNRYLLVLGIEQQPSVGAVDLAAVKRAHKKLARAAHPDLNRDDPTAERRFHEIQTAYERLVDLLA